MSADFEAAKARFLEGVAHAEAGRLPEADEALSASLALLPGRPSTLVNLGIVRLRRGRPQAALALLDAAVAAAPGDVDAWAQRGAACVALGHPADALASFERALALEPQHAGLRYQRAAALHRLGRVDDARHALEALVADAPDPAGAADAWSLLGQVHRDAGRRDAAIEAFERAIAAGGDAELAGYFLAALRGQDAPAVTPPGYVRVLFDDYAEDFDTHLVETLRYRAHEAVAQAALARRPQGFASVLDLGCGTGLVGGVLRSKSRRLEGVDLSPVMVERARNGGHYDQVSANDIATHLRETAQRHDLVTAADLFIYIGNLEAVFAGVRRVLEPGGLFVFSVEAFDGMGFVLRPTLRYAHSLAYLRELAARHGLAWHAAEPCVLREEQRSGVDGWIVALGA